MSSLRIQIAIALQFVMMGLSAGGPTLANVTYAVLGPFPEGNREVADPLEAFGGIDVAYSLFLRNGSSAMLYPTELADGGNVTWSNATADGSGNVNMPFSTVRFDFLNAAFGPFLLGVQGWAIGERNYAPPKLLPCAHRLVSQMM